MRRHWKKLALVLAALATCALFAVLASDPQPSYQGRKLSEWINHRDTTTDTNNSELDALLHMGTNTLSHLVDWACPDPTPQWKVAIVDNCLKHQSGPNQSNLTVRLAIWLLGKYARADYANRALGLLGTNAYPALPELANRIADAQNQPSATRARYATISVLYGWPPPPVREMRSMEQRAFQDPNPIVRQAATNVHDLVTALTAK
jgi:hypothetical protein